MILTTMLCAALAGERVKEIAASEVQCNGLGFQLSIGRSKSRHVIELTIRCDEEGPKIFGGFLPILDTRLTASDGRTRVYDQFGAALDAYPEPRLTTTGFEISVSLSRGQRFVCPLPFEEMLADFKPKGRVKVDVSFQEKEHSYHESMWEYFKSTPIYPEKLKYLWIGEAKLPTLTIRVP